MVKACLEVGVVNESHGRVDYVSKLGIKVPDLTHALTEFVVKK